MRIGISGANVFLNVLKSRCIAAAFFFSSADGIETINEARRCLPLQID